MAHSEPSDFQLQAKGVQVMTIAALILAGYLSVGYFFSELARIGQKKLQSTEMAVGDWVGVLMICPFCCTLGGKSEEAARTADKGARC